MSEIQLQAACFQWAWNQYPETRRLLWAVPNGMFTNKIQAMQMKASGMIAGVHDLHFFWRCRMYCFELKIGYNKMSKEQVEWAALMKSQGAEWFEIRSLEQFKSIFAGIITESKMSKVAIGS